MESEWAEGVLADACGSIDYGLTESASNENIGPRFLRITDIVSGHIDWKTVPHVAANDATVEKYRLYNADVVIARTGASTGSSAYVSNPPPAVFASYLIRLRVRPPFDARFIAYYLQSKDFWEFIRGVLGDKSAQPNASASTMTKAPLKYPQSQAEQRAIAQILGTLDDKIELNRRMSETLEAMVRALFQSWFVRRLPSGGSDALGELPDGWRVGTFADVAHSPRRGIEPSAIPSGTPYIALEHMPKRSIALSDWGVADGIESGKLTFSAGEILFGKLRPYFHKVGVAPVSGVCSTDIAVIAPKTPEWFSYSLCVASSDEFVAFTDAGSTGTKMPRTKWSEMARYPIAVPPAALAERFDACVRPLVARIVGGIHESRTLAALRDTLLPKLISGELRVKDPEKLVSKARQGVVAKR